MNFLTEEFAGDAGTEPPGEAGALGALRIAEDSIHELLRRHASDAVVRDLETQLDRREKFLALLIHDLRSPLMVAKMGAEQIARQYDDAELCRSFAPRVTKAIARAERMIRDLLDASRIQSGAGLALRTTEVDLISLIRTTIEEIEILSPGRCVFESQLVQGPLRGRWDPSALRRALENLLSNAIKYGTPNTPVTVIAVPADGRVRIMVHNFGEPISPGEIGQLFRWFGRTQAAESSGVAGWGLGLMLVKGIAENHGGSVSVESSRLQGTTFTIDLPITARDPRERDSA